MNNKVKLIEPLKNSYAPFPPLGWNSWDCYAATVSEEQLLQNAKYMAENLKEYGWEYIVCDIQWYEPAAGTTNETYRPVAELTMDEYSRLLPAPNRFPSSAGGKGFRPIADKIHAMGLKFGVHMMRGIPRQAAYARTKILGTNVTADMITNPFSSSRWNSDMYGVDASKEGAQEYYDSIFAQYAEWGVDYVKVDDICNTNMYQHDPYSAKAEIELINKAIENSGRKMVLSLSPGPAVIDEAWHLKKYANMWRITDDFWDKWELLLDMFRRCEVWQEHVGEGNWPDCDMLPIGKLTIGWNAPRYTDFTKAEQYTMMNLWCIFRSPLMMGGELTYNDDFTLSLLTNKDLLHLQKYGTKPKQLWFDKKSAAWANVDTDGNFYIALFNLSDDEKIVSCPLDITSDNKVNLFNLWTKEESTAENEIKAMIEPHGSVIYKLI